MRYKLISCEILYREVCAVVARARQIVDIEFMPKGLHDIGSPAMHAELQAAIDRVDREKYGAILLGYALCSNGIVGLRSPHLPMVIPRAHDCITLFLGSKERYADFFSSNPGVYYKTSGWIERGEGLEQQDPSSIARRMGLLEDFESLAKRYGEENAKYIYEQLGDLTRNYTKLVYIETGVEPDDRYEIHTRRLAEEKGWQYQKLIGDLSLLQAMVDGDWNESRFLVVPPGGEVVVSYDEKIIDLRLPADGSADGTGKRDS
ncbi:hypothetical protein JCM19992_26390 [Thermostilla marina]